MAKLPRLQRLWRSVPLWVVLAAATAASAAVIPFYPDLGWNLFADALALLFATYIVQRVLAEAAEKTNAPAHKAMVDDLLRLHQQVDRFVFLALRETTTEAELDVLRAAARGEGDVSEIIARLPLAAPAPMDLLGWRDQPQATWGQVIARGLSPTALRLETLIARYTSTADPKLRAALHAVENSLLMDFLRGQLRPGGSHLHPIFWRSLFQSMAKVYAELGPAMDRHADRGSINGPAPYLEGSIHFLEQGVWAKERSEGKLKVYPPVRWT